MAGAPRGRAEACTSCGALQGQGDPGRTTVSTDGGLVHSKARPVPPKQDRSLREEAG